MILPNRQRAFTDWMYGKTRRPVGLRWRRADVRTCRVKCMLEPCWLVVVVMAPAPACSACLDDSVDVSVIHE